MRINWILPELSKSGGVNVALHYANILNDNGHDVICYIPQSGLHYGWKRIFFLKDVFKFHLNDELRGKWFDNRFKFDFPVWINNRTVRDADINIATSWITSYWVAKINKGKRVYFIQDFETWGGEKINRAVLESYRLPFDELVVVSSALHDRLLSAVGVDARIVCNGIEDIFLTKLVKKNISDQVTIGMPYRENRGNDMKNCALGIRVLLKIKEKNPSIRIMCYGFKKPEGWNDKISFWVNPTRRELLQFYNMTDIFYVPSKYEGWGLPAMEAMAQENAVLAGNSGVIQEIGIDGQNCVILNNPMDESEAINKITDLIMNPSKRKIIGRNARKIVAGMTIKSSAAKFENILYSLIR